MHSPCSADHANPGGPPTVSCATRRSERPRGYLFDELFTRRLRRVAPRRPPRTCASSIARCRAGALALEVRRRSDEYDAIVSWSERLTLAMMASTALARTSKPHVAMNVLVLNVRAVRVPWPRGQHAALHRHMEHRAAAYAIRADSASRRRSSTSEALRRQLFWSPRDVPERENRHDLRRGRGDAAIPTLIRGSARTGLRFTIATDHVRVDRFGFGRPSARRASRASRGRTSPSGAVADRAARALRAFADSRRAAPPLGHGNGVTVILEAMAMASRDLLGTRVKSTSSRRGDRRLRPAGRSRCAARRDALTVERPERAHAMGRAGAHTSRSTTRSTSSVAT